MQMLGRVDGRSWQEDAKLLGDGCEVAVRFANETGSLPKEKRVALDVAAITETLAREMDFARWIPTKHMLADVLTKAMAKAPPYLEDVLSRGKLSLVESTEAKNVLAGRQAADGGEGDLAEIKEDQC